MIDNYAIFSIILRLMAEFVFVLILIQQVRVLFNKGKTHYLQLLLLLTLVMLAFGNGTTLFLNFFRQEDGNLMQFARQTGTVIGGITTFGAALALYLINKFKLK
jgi:hypothetical protein